MIRNPKLLNPLAALGLAFAFTVAPIAPAAFAQTPTGLEGCHRPLRESGVLGEQADGYLGVVKAADASAKRCADYINLQRRQEYNRIAEAKSESAENVGKLAAEKTIERLSPGMMYKDASGAWVKK